MGRRYSIFAKNREDKFWEYNDCYITNVLTLFFKAIYCCTKYDVVEIMKHG